MKTWSEVCGTATPQECFAAVQNRYIPERAQYEKTAAYIRTHQPQTAQEIIRQADAFMQGMMVLCGTNCQPFFVGNPPRWSDNAVGDAEYVFSLNRMSHWPVLVQAYYLTGELCYAEKVLSELENWIDTCPPLEVALDYATAKPRFSDVTPWRTLELGFRPTRSWNTVLQLLSALPCFSLALFEKLALCFYEHANILYHVCPVLWPNADHNHYLTECLGLFEITLLCDFFVQAPVWRAHAMHELERCAKTQILPGGGQIEGAPTYHNECLYQMTYSVQLAKRYGLSFSEEYETLVRSMFTHSLYTTRPDGNSVPWGDSDATPQVFLAAFAHYEAFHEDMPLRICATAFEPAPLWEAFHAHLWKLPDAAALDARMKSEAFTLPCVPEPVFCHNRALKHVMMRSGWERNADSVFFSARSPVHNDHAHIDPNSFDFCSHGVPILTDSGRFTYREGADRYYFKSGASHNTLMINGRDAFEYQGTWAYGPQKCGGILRAEQQPGLSYVVGTHSNYEPVVHTRVLGMTPHALFVLDVLENTSDIDFIDVYYQLNSIGAVLTHCGAKFTVPQHDISVSMAHSDCLCAELLEGRTSNSIDAEYSSQRLHLRTDGTRRSFLTVLCVRDKAFCAVETLPIDETAHTLSFGYILDGVASVYRLDKRTWELAAQ